MRIQHNIMAMSAYRNYTNNVSAMKKNLEKLSSGYKINRAGDDAAGLAISEKMRAQITGLETAQKNAKDGISLVQTAEGALTEVHDMLNRMVELASMSANGTYDNTTDRAQLQKEMDQLTSEINRIADSSNFNGINLLDGSMDANAITGATYTTVENSKILDLIPDVDTAQDQTTVDATKTVLETESMAASKAGFEVDMENASIKATKDGTFTLTVAGQDLTVDMVTDQKLSGKDLAKAIADNNATVQINGNDYTVKADGTKLIFSSDAEEKNMEVNGDVTFKFEPTVQGSDVIDDDAINLPKAPASIGGTFTAGVATGSNVTNLVVKADGLDHDKVAAAITAAGGNDLKIEAGTGDYDGKLVLTSGGEVIGVSNAEITGAADNNTAGGTAYTFVGVDKDKTALGSVTLAGTGTNTVSADDLKATDPFAIPGLTVTAATTATTAAGTDLKDALDTAKAGSGNVSVQFKETDDAGNDIYTITAGGKSIDAIGTVTTGKLTLNGIKDDGTADTTELLTFTGTNGTDDADAFKGYLADAFDTGLAYVADTEAEISGTVDGGIQNPTSFNSGAASKVANTQVDFNEVGAWTDGSKIKIGDTTYTVALGKDSVFKNASNVIDLTDMETADTKIAAQRLSVAAKDNKTFIVGHDGAGKTTLQQRVSVKDSTDMTTREKIAGYLGVSTLDAEASDPKPGTGLTLQIGDTADSYNQLKVSIKDMHASSLGLDAIKISDQASAADAIKVIKDAINSVSDVRGTLGATQNRLDHTINNLSVMTENIQDAESTIRDVDVAEEMMAYTKNNILIQSAQAMLAQANQVPQGVLQLLG